jgi:hypothetical protein
MVHSYPTALRLCWCAPTCPFVMVVLDVTEATSLRDATLLKGADSLLLQLSVCLSVCVSLRFNASLH